MRVLTVVGALCSVACFAQVQEAPPPPIEPDGTVDQAYADDTCAARPVAIVRGKVPADIVTSEPGWHYEGAALHQAHRARARLLACGDRDGLRVPGAHG